MDLTAPNLIQDLPAANPDIDPIIQFEEWFAFAQNANIYLPEAMTLATTTSDGFPSARIVLLKQVSQKGFVFFTNYESRKGCELDSNPKAALVLHWATLERQIRIEGPVERITREESEVYFQSRPRGSRIGAWASDQSSTLRDRSHLKERVHYFEQKYAGQEVPLPERWGGFRVLPEKIEFWQGRQSRLHERLIYAKLPSGHWDTELLFP
ncbi:MAG: pyridoxamine 5'-phosphate oxidase [Rhodothermaceae bacterium]|nr:pyridoxamine 5'-phosphate oxidase [Rhodothermaceae bacterium]MYE62810.1 pyridoxamine 5'-phosphate oxidase [Rhodothermaceae bacterium]MYJ20118.1 pyridoxamine 5'-phosphate oxidase [Rhodothermaceae bacterium]